MVDVDALMPCQHNLNSRGSARAENEVMWSSGKIRPDVLEHNLDGLEGAAETPSPGALVFRCDFA
jgi:hypothetical protein